MLSLAKPEKSDPVKKNSTTGKNAIDETAMNQSARATIVLVFLEYSNYDQIIGERFSSMSVILDDLITQSIFGGSKNMLVCQITASAPDDR